MSRSSDIDHTVRHWQPAAYEETSAPFFITRYSVVQCSNFHSTVITLPKASNESRGGGGQSKDDRRTLLNECSFCGSGLLQISAYALKIKKGLNPLKHHEVAKDKKKKNGGDTWQGRKPKSSARANGPATSLAERKLETVNDQYKKYHVCTETLNQRYTLW